ncbi:MAG: hypothetical protein AAF318_02625 [Pseudomonadota bacterium]
MSLLDYWTARWTQPFCSHRWTLVGFADDSREGWVRVERCSACGAYRQVAPGETRRVTSGLTVAAAERARAVEKDLSLT